MLTVKRKVRSAGRSSGSIEITLPPAMHALEGIECRLTLRDGARPEIVIQPDVTIAQVVFEELWDRLRVAFQQIGDIGSFLLSDFNVSFLPSRHWHNRPPLSYRDALTIYRSNQEKFQANSHQNGFSHVITFLTVGAGYRLGLEGRYALAFGVIVGYLISGMSVAHGMDFEQDLALRLFNGHHDHDEQSVEHARLSSLFSSGQWEAEEAQEGFKHIYDQVRGWQDEPASYEAARNRWWKNLKL